MKHYDWSESKNSKLKAERDVCFEDVITAIDVNRVIDDITHPNRMRYMSQRVMIVEIENYAYIVPYVEDEVKVFFKTIIPSRKATRKYLRGA